MTAPAPSVRLRGVNLSFGEVQAVKDVDLEIYPGKIHALLGENGAGKTTLMGLLAGLHRPDSGRIELHGRPISLRNGPRDALEAGVGMVHQHFMLVPSLTAAENIYLGSGRLPPLLRPARISRSVRRRARELELNIADVDTRVQDLSVGEQQRVEILRVLCRGAISLLILDEPTAVLSPAEAESLFSSMEALAAGGCTVVIISHKLEELRRVAHHLIIMRRGRVVGQHPDPASLSTEELAAEMVGHDLSLELDPGLAPSVGEELLRVRGLRVASPRRDSEVKGVDFSLRAGEILGLAGVGGNGQRELLEAIAGLLPAAAGTLRLCGRDLAGVDAAGRVGLGLRYVPEDRVHTGTAAGMSVRENLLLRDYRRPPCRRGPWLDLRALDPRCEEQLRALQVSTTGLSQRAGMLSGGNIQKLILARELVGFSEPAKVILAMHPTRGLDAWATLQVRRRLQEARAGGAAVLLCSEDLEEVLALGDRVAVMSGGRLVGEFSRQEADLARVGALMGGEAGR